MMNKILSISAILVVIIAIWYFGFSWNKEKAIKIIMEFENNAEKAKGSNKVLTDAIYKTYGEDYLIDRAKAIKNNNVNFTNKGKVYVTATGRAK